MLTVHLDEGRYLTQRFSNTFRQNMAGRVEEFDDTFAVLDFMEEAAALNALRVPPQDLCDSDLEAAILHAEYTLRMARADHDRYERRFWRRRLLKLRDEYYQRGFLLTEIA